MLFFFCVLCVWDRWIYSNIEDTFSHFRETRCMMEYLSWFYAQLETERLIVGRNLEWILIGMFRFIYWHWILHEGFVDGNEICSNKLDIFWENNIFKISEWFWELGYSTKNVFSSRITPQIYFSQSWDKAIHRNSHWMEETINFLSQNSNKSPFASALLFSIKFAFRKWKITFKEIQPQSICKGKIPIIQPTQNKNDCRVVCNILHKLLHGKSGKR